jgi:hypothetical protein
VIHESKRPERFIGSPDAMVERAAGRAEDERQAVDQESGSPRAISPPGPPEEDKPTEGHDEPGAVTPGTHRLSGIKKFHDESRRFKVTDRDALAL